MVKLLPSRIHVTRIHSIILISCLILVQFGNLYSQSQENISVLIHDLAIERIAIRGQSASFPYPILAFISVVDNEGNIIRNLAKTTDWLGPADLAENGRQISEIWNPIVEFQKNNPYSQQNKNLYEQVPDAKFIEICETCESIISASTMLLMDVSSSIKGELLERGKASIKQFIGEMRPSDRTGIIQFAGVNDSLPTLPITSNKDSLIAFVDQAKIDNWTPLYRALMQAIQMIKNETTLRRSIIIYTDGRNALPDFKEEIFTPDSIIINAQKYKIPIFTVALNQYTNEIVLKRIASNTGGFFFKSVDGSELNDIYRKISDIIQNFYVMAYTSPDPCTLDSLRIVDVSVNDSNRTGKGRTSYIYSGASKNYDLELIKSSSVDTVCAGDTFLYTLRLNNLGPITAFNFGLQETIPEFLTISDYQPLPDKIQGNTVFWKFDSLAADTDTTITFMAKIHEIIPDSISTFINKSQVLASCDTNSLNDFAEDTVYFDPVRCYTDISVKKYALTSSFKVQNSDTLWFADEGETISYFIKVINQENFEARNVTLNDTLPDFLHVDSTSIQGSLQWNLGTLPPFSDTTVTYRATVSATPPEGTNLLINMATVQALNEDPAKLTNNVAVDTVFNIRLADIAILSTVKTDSFTINGSDTLWFAQAGESYTTILTVTNTDNLEAKNVKLTNVLPDSVRTDTMAFGDSIQWSLGNLPAFEDTTLSFTASVSPNMPEGFNVLTNTAFVHADNENPDRLANNMVIDTVFNYVEPVIIDVSVRSFAQTDSFVVQGPDTIWFAQTGEDYAYFITVKNETKFVAENVILKDILPDSVSTGNFSSGDTLQWNLGQLIPYSDTTLTFTAAVAPMMPEGTNLLINTISIQAEDEEPDRLANNVVTDTVFNYVEPVIIDVSVQNYVQTDSFVVQGPDTIWFAQSGKDYSYFITVSNETKFEAENVILKDVLPDSVHTGNFSGGDTLQWNLGQLIPYSDTTLTFTAAVAPMMPEGTNWLINTVLVQAENEKPDKLANNVVSDTVFNYVEPVIIDVSVQSFAQTDSFVVQGPDTLWFAQSGKNYSYFITVSNETKFEVENVVVKDILPDSVSVGTFFGADTLQWNLGHLKPYSDTTLTFTVTVAPIMPEGTNRLINMVLVQAEDEEPDKLANNVAMDTVFNYVEPVIIDVSVQSFAQTDSFVVQGADTIWFAQTGEDYSYFITVTNETKFEAENVVVKDILPDSVHTSNFFGGDTLQWNLGNLLPFTEKVIKFNVQVSSKISTNIIELINTVLVQADEEEPNLLYNNISRTTVYTVPPNQGCSLFSLDLNIFKPEMVGALGINFELNSSRSACLEVYDVSGYLIRNLAETVFNSGANRIEWDGTTTNGQKVGSGVYIITLRSGNLICWKKVIIVR